MGDCGNRAGSHGALCQNNLTYFIPNHSLSFSFYNILIHIYIYLGFWCCPPSLQLIHFKGEGKKTRKRLQLLYPPFSTTSTRSFSLISLFYFSVSLLPFFLLFFFSSFFHFLSFSFFSSPYTLTPPFLIYIFPFRIFEVLKKFFFFLSQFGFQTLHFVIVTCKEEKPPVYCNAKTIAATPAHILSWNDRVCAYVQSLQPRKRSTQHFAPFVIISPSFLPSNPPLSAYVFSSE